MKTCSQCGKEKGFQDFSRDSRGVSGRRPSCKQCVNERMKSYYARTKETRRDYGRAYRLANRDKLILADRAKYQANRDRALARQREWYLQNKTRQAETTERNRRRMLNDTRAVAHRAGLPWEEWEDAEILEKATTIRDLAFRLGRSYEAVRGRRAVLTRKALAEM